jgi:hypothetical protein
MPRIELRARTQKDFYGVFHPELSDVLRRMVAITQRHFERWFNKVHASHDSTPELDRATAVALEDVRSWVAELGR